VVFTVAGDSQTSGAAIITAEDGAEIQPVMMLVFDRDFVTIDQVGVASAVGTGLGQLRDSIATMTLFEGSVVVLIMFEPGTLLVTPTQFQILVDNETWTATDVLTCFPGDGVLCSLSNGIADDIDADVDASSDNASSESAGLAAGVTVAVLLVLSVVVFIVIQRRRANSRDKTPTLPTYEAPSPVVENPALADSLELAPMREPEPAAGKRSYEAVNGKVPSGPPIDANGLAQQVSGSIANDVASEYSFHNIAREASVKVEPIDNSECPAASARAAPERLENRVCAEINETAAGVPGNPDRQQDDSRYVAKGEGAPKNDVTAAALATIPADHREADGLADEGKWAGTVDSNVFVRDPSGQSLRLHSIRRSTDGNVVESDGTLAETAET
jgi:hypothetical protein